jgi:Protein of unknown function (DUF3383)
MAAIDQIVNINISQSTQAVAQASFSIPLIVGPTNAGWSDFVHAYSSPAGMLTDGFTTSSPEYIYALELFEQTLTPTQFYVGHRTAAVAQVDTLAVNTLNTAHLYAFTLDGVLISYQAVGGDTQQAILTALNAAITTAFPSGAPTAGVVTGSGSGALLTLTSTQIGLAVTYSAVDSLLTHALVTANNGIATDLANIQGENDSWYGMVGCAFTDADIEQAAAYIQAQKKIFVAVSSTAAIATTATTDLGSFLKGKSYTRTALIFTAASYVAEGKDAAWVGGQLPYTPGANNWAFKTLVGCTADTLTQGQQSILIGDPVAGVAGKNVNIYQVVGGVPITEMGTMASGQYIDVTVGVDWLESTLQTNIYSALVNSAKIPYTDKGTGILISAVKAAIDQGVVNGLIDGNSPIIISAPPVLSVSANQRAQRIAPTITFSCRLAGAFNAVVVNGTVTV